MVGRMEGDESDDGPEEFTYAWSFMDNVVILSRTNHNVAHESYSGMVETRSDRIGHKFRSSYRYDNRSISYLNSCCY